MTEAHTELIEKAHTIDPYRTIMCPLEYLRPAEYNPRTIDEDSLESLKKSIKRNGEFFMVRPIVANLAKGREGIIIGGDKRYQAAVSLGMEKVPVMFVIAETVEKEKAWNLLDNKNSGEWDRKKLKQVVIELHESAYDLESIGHTPDEIVGIMGFEVNLDDDPMSAAGSTPAKKCLQCPECSYIGLKKDFKKVDGPETEETPEEQSV